MFDIASTELLLIAVVAVLVIGPKDLPRALYKFGQIVGKARGMARHFRSGIDAMVREAELEELQKQWAKQNQKIMDETRNTEFSDPASTPALQDHSAPELLGDRDDKVATDDAPSHPGETVEDAGPAHKPDAPAGESMAQSSLPLGTSDEPNGPRTA
ncbi:MULTISPECIES: Sec-independent protein translocase protein TatB [unclassified Sphingobium]|uniref:Sec-independent protein translocase protein TatB n=1 Tax=unclassified Sphingobium TaxID=2611147 RepID=UPI00222459F3|nr:MULTISPECIES: Sec-independent protein translocase protein TatB [unclassified Sphingobium]MCW2380951.1 sec-independent protein translocase protein TatB [Sphingobium sp. B2D3B]MCW2398943.1 sec-independent protein translocase protein TatB [Sphingobium sp. B2D3C]